MRRAVFLCLTILAAPPLFAAAPRIVAAAGRWAALQQGSVCEAASMAVRPALRYRPQARASLSFDSRRHGQFAARLSAVPRAGATVMLMIGATPFLLVSRGDRAWSTGPRQEAAIIAALRAEGGMRIDSRAASGGRIVDRYELAGAPIAIDAAAACAATVANRRVSL